MRDDKVAICVPSNGLWVSRFGVSLAKLCARLASDARITSSVMQMDSSVICRSRQLLLEACLELDMTHALFLDSDMTFPADTAHRLLQHRKEIVACHVACRGFPIKSNAVGRRPDRGFSQLAPKQYGTGLAEVEFVGTAVMLIDVSLLRRMPKPWFLFGYNQEVANKWTMTEDYYFCYKAKEAGCKIYVDLDLSREIGHIGQFEYRLEPRPEPIRAENLDERHLAELVAAGSIELSRRFGETPESSG